MGTWEEKEYRNERESSSTFSWRTSLNPQVFCWKETLSEHSPEKEIGKLMPEEMSRLPGPAPSTLGLRPFGARKGKEVVCALASTVGGWQSHHNVEHRILA